MGGAASIINGTDPNLTPAEKRQYVEKILHGECEDLAGVFAEEFRRLKDGSFESHEIREHLLNTLRIKQAEIVSSLKLENATTPLSPTSSSDGDEVKAADKFVNLVAEANTKLATKSAHTYLVCVDGSNHADNAFKTAMHLKRKVDHLVIFHSYRTGARAEHLPPAYRPAEVRLKYESQLIGAYPSRAYTIAFHERGDDESARDILQDVIKQCKDPDRDRRRYIGNKQPDFLIIGFSGRKSEAENRAIMGSAADLALRTLHIPIIIAKTVCSADVRSFVYCVDNSTTSRLGLDILLTLINPRDSLVVLNFRPTVMDHIMQSDLEKTERHFVEELQRSGPPNSRFESIPVVVGKTIADNIVDHIAENITADFLVVAPRAQSHITSVTEQIILKSQISVILCKV